MEPVVTEEIIACQPPQSQAIIRLLLARIAELEAKVQQLQRQAKGKTPQNSSLPPSSQHPHARPQRPKPKSGKKRGGQPGHAKHERPLIPTEECNHVESCKPEECRRCGTKLSGNDPQPLRHQVWGLPTQEHLNIDETGTKEANGKAWLWTFLRRQGVEPTNNAGERSLRHAVIWRKLSFGAQSSAGSRFVETMLTVIETCRQQGRNVFAFLTNAVEAHLAHQSAPSLLPRA